jgi:hypothetical protein
MSLTNTYEGLVIDKASRDYLETFKKNFPAMKRYTLKNVNVLHTRGHNCFSLHMSDSYGIVVHEESFCFSDF